MASFQKLERELQRLSPGGIMLVETKAEKMSEVSTAIVKILLRRKQNHYNLIVLSASRPCTTLLDFYRRNGVEASNVFILCLVCRSEGLEPASSPSNVTHLESVAALTDISLSLSRLIEYLRRNQFVLVDSVTSMLIHNRPEIFARFIHSILTKMRVKGVRGVLLSSESEKETEVRAEIAQLCDKVVMV